MEHKTVGATTAATDAGEFSALAATYSVDRVGDAIRPGAFQATIERWRSSGKRVPLHWNHRGEAENVIGYIDPATMRETDEGLYIEGKLDLEASAVAREAWRSMKNEAVALSFGYKVDDERERADGTSELIALDLYEISMVAAPANPDTRFLSLKSVERRPVQIASFEC